MKVLFVCTGNTCRSPMAEVMAKNIFEGSEYRFSSAGVHAINGDKASENAILAAKSKDLDLRSHISRRVTYDMLEKADIIIAMTSGHKEVLTTEIKTPVYTIFEYVGEKGEVIDPYGHDVETYIDCIENLEELLVKMYKKSKE